MRKLMFPPLADLASLTGTTVVFRERNGEPEYVVVCGECEEIKVIGLKEGMRAALQQFLGWHRQDRHSSSVPQARPGEGHPYAPAVADTYEDIT